MQRHPRSHLRLLSHVSHLSLLLISLSHITKQTPYAKQSMGIRRSTLRIQATNSIQRAKASPQALIQTGARPSQTPAHAMRFVPCRDAVQFSSYADRIFPRARFSFVLSIRQRKFVPWGGKRDQTYERSFCWPPRKREKRLPPMTRAFLAGFSSATSRSIS